MGTISGRQAGGLGVSPRFSHRAGGWEEQRDRESRTLNRECRGAKPLCREARGVSPRNLINTTRAGGKDDTAISIRGSGQFAMTNDPSESRAYVLQTVREAPSVVLSDMPVWSVGGYAAKEPGARGRLDRLFVSASGRRQAGGLGVSPRFSHRAGGWEARHCEVRKAEHHARRDKGAGLALVWQAR